MGAGWQRWWREPVVLEEPAGDDGIEFRWHSVMEHAPTWWYCESCFTIGSSRFHCCPASGYRYTVDFEGLGFK